MLQPKSSPPPARILALLLGLSLCANGLLGQDSLTETYTEQASYYRSADSLAAWAYTYWDWQAEVFEDSEQALSLLDRAVEGAWRKPRNAEEAEAMLWVETNRGYHLFRLGKVLAAVKAYEAALDWQAAYSGIAFELIDYLYLPLGAHYTRLGENARAQALYEQAIAEHEGDPQDAQLGGIYNNLGLSYWNEGRYERAIATYERGLACEGLPPITAARLRLSLAQTYLDMEQLGRASSLLRQVMGTLSPLPAKTPPAEGLSDCLSGAYLLQGWLLGAEGQSAAALASLEKALAYGKQARGTGQHRDIAKIWVAFGQLRLQAGQPEQAQQAFQQALGSLIPNFPAGQLGALPRPEQLYEENTLYEALEGRAEALLAQHQRQADLGKLRDALESHRLAGQVEHKLQQLLQYESSRISLAAQRRQRLGKAIGIARALYEATGDEALLYRAWANAEQAKSALLLEAVQRHHFSGLLSAEDGLLSQARQLRQQLAYFERSLLLAPQAEERVEWLSQRDELLQSLAVAEAQLAQRHPAWAAWQEQGAGLEAADISNMRAQLPGYTLIEYFVGADQVEVFAQAPDGPASWHRIPYPDTLAGQVQRLLSLLRSRTAMQAATTYGEQAHAIYQQLLQPVLAADRSQALLIVPDAWLSLLPFEALWYEPAATAAWAKAPFLIKQHKLHYAFSLAVLAGQRRMEARADRHFLQLAPRFEAGQRGLMPLKYGELEAPPAPLCRSRQYWDGDASFERLQAEGRDYRIVHLSTHAEVDSSGLLPRVEFYDKAAYLPDIYALELQAELVVLSACQTGLGVFQEGEGLMSLARAFAYTGTKGLAASLWAINDAATADVLQRMYAYLQQGAAKPDALHQAKLAYLADPEVAAFQKSPYYWAGLVYLGDERALGWVDCPWRVKNWWMLALAALGIGGLLWWVRRRNQKIKP